MNSKKPLKLVEIKSAERLIAESVAGIHSQTLQLVSLG